METDNSTDTLSDEGTIPAADDTALDEQELAEYLEPNPENKRSSTEFLTQDDKTQPLASVEKAEKIEQPDSVASSTSVVPEEKNDKEEDVHEPVAMEITDADDEDSSFNHSCSSSSTPIKHLDPPTPHPQSSMKKPRRDTRSTQNTKASSSAKFPQRPGIVWKEGTRVEARDFQDKWYAAKILELDSSDNTILVHFEGWNSRFDEWLSMDSERIRCMTRHSERKETRSKSTNKAEHKIGESVFAKWTDCRMYPGKIVAITSAGNYDVLFYDGFKKTVVPINVKTMPEDVQQEYAKAGLLPEVGKKNKFPIKDLAKEIQEKNKVKSPESSRKSRSDHERRSSIDKDKKEGKKEVKKEESWEAKPTTEKRRKSGENQQHVGIKRQKSETTKEDSEERKEKKDSGKDEVKVKKDIPKGARPSKEKATSPVGKKGEKTTPKSTHRAFVSPADTLTTEPPSEEYSCPYEACTKTFRKKSLVDYHVKYYHTDDGTPVQHQPIHRKRKSTAGSEDGEVSTISSRHKSRRRREVRSSLDGSSQPSLHTEDALSEDTKTSTTEDYQQAVLDSDEEEAREGVDRIEKDEVVNCICQINEENGLMIQCDVCLCWQHAVCMEITEETLPAKYVCYVCANPPGVRESGRYIYDQDWIKQGTMHKFSFLPEDRHSKKKARIMEATHALVGDMIGVKSVLNSVKRELGQVSNPESSELKLWKENLDPLVRKINRENESYSNCDTGNNVLQNQSEQTAVDSGKNLKSETKSTDEVKSESETESNKVTEKKTESNCNKANESNCDIKEVKTEHLDSEIESDNITEAQQETSSEVVKMEEEENVFEKCSLNLLEHISHLHDSIEERLDLIEQQVTELEAVEEGKNCSILKDVPKVKKTMHQLITDLYKVKRLAMYH